MFQTIWLFSVNADDVLSQVSLVEFGYRLLGRASVQAWLNGTFISQRRWVANLVTTNRPEGRYQLSVRATDFAGNQELDDNASVITIDHTKPNVHLYSPVEGSFNRGDLIFQCVI